MFKKLLLVFLLSFLMIEFTNSQDSLANNPEKIKVKHPNIIKINTLALPFSNLALIYERAIIPRLSASISLGYKYGGFVPDILYLSNSVFKFEMEQAQGFTITPDVRYYLRSCDAGKLEGFYAGIYLRYTYYTTGTNIEYTQINLPLETPHADIVIQEYGLGIELGYQLILWERFSIDFLFIGSRYSNYRLGYKFDKEPSQEFLDDLSAYLNDAVDRLGLGGDIKVEQEKQSDFRTNFSFLSMRFGLSLGFAF